MQKVILIRQFPLIFYFRFITPRYAAIPAICAIHQFAVPCLYSTDCKSQNVPLTFPLSAFEATKRGSRTWAGGYTFGHWVMIRVVVVCCSLALAVAEPYAEGVA